MPSSTIRRVLLVASNPAKHPAGWPVGFWASELTHPWFAFFEAGLQPVIASPLGGIIQPDAMSDPRDPSGYSADDFLSRRFLDTPSLSALLAMTEPLDEVAVDDFDAVVVIGGQAPPFTLRHEATLQRLLRSFYEGGKVTAALCHGVAALLDVTLSDGQPLLAGRTVTGFSNLEEDAVDAMMGLRVMPYRIEDEVKKRGARYLRGGLWKPFAVRDGNLVTGQQQFSAIAVARQVLGGMGVAVPAIAREEQAATELQ